MLWDLSTVCSWLNGNSTKWDFLGRRSAPQTLVYKWEDCNCFSTHVSQTTKKHVKVQTLILFLHEKVYLKWIYFFNIKWAETSYGTRRCSPQLSGSTVKCRVRSGHFDHDFWIFTLFACRSEKWKFANSPKRREFGTTSGSGTLVWQRESRKRFCTSSCLFIEKQILVQN